MSVNLSTNEREELLSSTFMLEKMNIPEEKKINEVPTSYTEFPAFEKKNESFL